jgi:hypothetical protein
MLSHPLCALPHLQPATLWLLLQPLLSFPVTEQSGTVSPGLCPPGLELLLAGDSLWHLGVVSQESV